MIVIILAGGKSSRIGVEKPLIEVGGKKMIDIAVDAAKDSKANDFFVAVSDNAKKTKEYCLKRYNTIETPGDGYHEDLKTLLKSYPEFISLSSDIPFLGGEHIDFIIDAYKGCSITGALRRDVLPQGVTPGFVFEHEKKSLVAVGLNIVTLSESSSVLIFNDPLIGINVNTKEDLKIANALSM